MVGQEVPATEAMPAQGQAQATLAEVEEEQAQTAWEFLPMGTPEPLEPPTTVDFQQARSQNSSFPSFVHHRRTASPWL